MVSIIIPIYNSADYIDRCLKSVVNQKYNDWECIIINDGSIDNSLSLCKKWQKLDDRIIVLSQQNKGVSSARNAGLKVVRGEYVCFIDSDDLVEPGYVSDMIEYLQDADMVVTGVKKHFLSSRKDEEDNVPYTGYFNLNINHISEFAKLNENSLLYGPCNKLYRMDIIREKKIEFPIDYTYGEDLIFNFEYLQYVHKIALVNRVNYIYEIHAESLSQRFRPTAFFNDYTLWKVRAEFMKKRKLWMNETKRVMYRYMWWQIYEGIFACCNLQGQSYEYIKRVLSIPEIDDLGNFEDCFNCSWWIRFLIKKRQSFLLYCILNVRKWIYRI